MADQKSLGSADPHEEIVRLEERIEELVAKIESCRKFILASRIAVAGGGLVLAAILVGAIRSDLAPMAAAVASLLGGIVVWGSKVRLCGAAGPPPSTRASSVRNALQRA